MQANFVRIKQQQKGRFHWRTSASSSLSRRQLDRHQNSKQVNDLFERGGAGGCAGFTFDAFEFDHSQMNAHLNRAMYDMAGSHPEIMMNGPFLSSNLSNVGDASLTRVDTILCKNNTIQTHCSPLHKKISFCGSTPLIMSCRCFPSWKSLRMSRDGGIEW